MRRWIVKRYNNDEKYTQIYLDVKHLEVLVYEMVKEPKKWFKEELERIEMGDTV